MYIYSQSDNNYSIRKFKKYIKNKYKIKTKQLLYINHQTGFQKKIQKKENILTCKGNFGYAQDFDTLIDETNKVIKIFYLIYRVGKIQLC